MKNSRDLILGEVVYISIIYPRFLSSFIEWLRSLVLMTWLVKTAGEFSFSCDVFILKVVQLFFKSSYNHGSFNDVCERVVEKEELITTSS